MTLPAASEEQQAILDLGLTSIRVRAGAGTGKTTTVAMVIANLVAEHGVMPEQILGITFTNKAAAELADKVREALTDDIDPGRQVEVHTYHGFASQLLSEFGALAGFDNRARVITPTFSRQLLAESFYSRSYDHIDITWRGTLDRVRQLGDRMGDHLLDPRDVIAAGRDKEDDIWKARVEMAETLIDYHSDKRRLGVVDYSDLVTGSTRVMEAHPHLAAAVRDRYRAVVLDEYQDTNPAQRVLLTTIFTDGFPVIAVGDEDQTIYEWRGASAENFEKFPTHFPTADGTPAHERGLLLNRRSSSEILTLANEVREQANPGAEPLEAMADKPAGDVVTYWAEDAVKEADWIAGRFEELHSEGEPWRNMAVLFRKNKDFAVVIESMARHDIPIEVANVGGLLSVPEIAELRAWLTILEHPEDSTALTHVLFGSRFRLGLADIAPLSRHAGAENASRESVEDPTPVTLLEAIEVAGEVPGLRPEAVAALGRFNEIYRDVLTESQGLSLVETLRLILDRTRAWQDIEALPPNSRLTARLNVYRLLDLAEDWSPLQGRPSLGTFLDYLTIMEEEPAEELDSAHLSGEDAVTLVTVHRAKGLEWENVAIPALTKGSFPSSSGQFPDSIRFAESLPQGLRIDSFMSDLPEDRKDRDTFLRERHSAQEWRTAYVALTRAKRRLFLTGAYWYGLPEPTKTPKKPSELFGIAESSDVSRSLGHVEVTDRPSLLRAPIPTANPDPLFADGWASALRVEPRSIAALAANRGVTDEYGQTVEQTKQRLFDLAKPATSADADEPGVASVTGLVTYAQCPKRFFWTDVDPLPRRRNPAATHGTEVHRRIELHQRGQVPFEEMTDDLYDIVAGESGDDGAGPGGYDAYIESRFATEKAALIEVPFTFELEHGFRVRGRIDAVYCDGPKWEVVDFKSGRPSSDPSREVQLQAYAIAAQDVNFGLAPPEELDVTFAYLGRGLNVETTRADETWVDEARVNLNTMATAITDEQFNESPGQWCGNCDFLQFCEPGRQEMAK